MDIGALLEKQKVFYNQGTCKGLTYRKNALLRLKNRLLEQETEIFAALQEDLGKSAQESYLSELSMVLGEIRHMVKHLERWAKPERVKSNLAVFPGKSILYKEPFGTVLVLSPWNYPFQLALIALIGAVAAGNCVVLAPSGHSPKTSALLKKIVSVVFRPEHCCCIYEEFESHEQLMEAHFDFIFFTGGEQVGKSVMQAAAKHLTPVVLELGGKSPCIVEADGEIALAAKRIVWGKFLNAGQTCVAPDYVLVHEQVKEALLAAMKKAICTMFSEHPLQQEAYPKIIHQQHFKRLIQLIDVEKLAFGGGYDERTLKIEPTLVDSVQFDDALMEEEIFGPILPIISYHSLTEVIEFLQSKPSPLALYLFTKSPKCQRRVIEALAFGGGCINDTISHITNPNLPFGGVGASGMGAYHGKFSFDTFSHRKSVVKRGRFPDFSLRYQPYTHQALQLLKKILK